MEAGNGNKAPVFSIVVPVYNAKKFLEKSLGSILAQTFSDFELILVNDASADGSLTICKKYAALDHRIVLIDCPENHGAAEARNWGIKAAKGCYLCFVDADDYVEPDFLARFYETLQSDDYDFIKCGAYEEYYDMDEKPIYTKACILPDKAFFGIKVVLDQVVDMEQIPLFGYNWNSVYRMDIIKERHLRFDKAMRVHEDFVFNMAYLPFIRKMRCLSYCGYHYIKRNSGSLSYQKGYYDYEKRLLKVRSFLSFLKESQNETQVNLDKVYWMFTRCSFSALEWDTSMEKVRKDPIYVAYRKHCFGPVGLKKKILIAVLQSNHSFLIKPIVWLMGFVQQYFPVLFAKIKR